MYGISGVQSSREKQNNRHLGYEPARLSQLVDCAASRNGCRGAVVDSTCTEKQLSHCSIAKGACRTGSQQSAEVD